MPHSPVLNRRHRRTHYALEQKSSSRSLVRPIIALLFAALLFYVAGKKIFEIFGVGNTIRQSSIMLTFNDQETVNVSIEGEEYKRAEDQLKLYPGDRVTTGGRSNALLSFFDGTNVRLDERTELSVEKSTHGEETSQISLTLIEGSIWVAVPTTQTYSGSIVRTIRTPDLNLSLPARTEAVVSLSSIAVFAADDLGITVWLTGRKNSILIGEGQQLSVPHKTVITDDPYRYRTPLNPLAIRSPFVEENRKKHSEKTAQSEDELSEPLTSTDDVITLTEPIEGITVKTSTIRVSGRVGPQIAQVRINGYLVAINEDMRSFSQDLALPEADEVRILAEALAEDGIVMGESRRTITRDREPPEPPTITSPAAAGQTYLTSREKVEIKGETSPDTVGILVNDYRLQLFNPGDETWSYLASTILENLQQGENIYEVTAINKGGYKSKPSTITIFIGEGEEGIIEVDEEEIITEEDTTGELIENVPLLRGSLAVTGPTPGTFHTATGSAMLIEGTTSERTHSVWVNDYKLQLFDPGKTFWNYIADAKLGTLRRGTNVYHVTARDEDRKILDEIEYTIYLNPREL